MLGVYYLQKNGSIIWISKEKIGRAYLPHYFNNPAVLKYWVVPDILPGGTITSGKEWILKIIAEMIDLGGKNDDVRQIAVDGFSMPIAVFQSIYNEIMDRKVK